MQNQLTSYAEWKSNARMGLMQDPGESEVSVIQISTPAMQGTLAAPLNQEEFIYYVQRWDETAPFEYRHQDNERWSRCPLRAGHVMLFPRRHQFIGTARSAMKVLSVALKRSALSPLLNEYFAGDPESLCIYLHVGIEDVHIHTLMHQLQSAYQRSDQMALDCLGQTLGLHLFLNYSKSRSTRKPRDYRLTPWQRRQFDEYIRTHLDQKISLASLAQTLGISRAHLTRMVRRSTGLSPHQYVLAQRVAHAQHLLRQGQHTIAEIACLTGFTDQSHLSRTFRQSFGVPPSQMFAPPL
jgi:AraC family transcriptional regulator